MHIEVREPEHQIGKRELVLKKYNSKILTKLVEEYKRYKRGSATEEEYLDYYSQITNDIVPPPASDLTRLVIDSCEIWGSILCHKY